MREKEATDNRVLGIFGLAMINIVAIASLRDLPQMATYGVGSIFFYGVAEVLFFVPVSLVAAELATAWPERGGSTSGSARLSASSGPS
jgi:hypothetical protein